VDVQLSEGDDHDAEDILMNTAEHYVEWQLHHVLPPRPESIRFAREATAELLARHNWDDEQVERAKLVVSELATNAVLHAGTPFELFGHVDEVARVQVRDQAPDQLPVVRDVALDSPGEVVGGMGLNMVERICDRWGVEVNDTSKTIWCQLGQK
jgi:anti-sigma regulatory factor (Ser/Thr protein kinase)